MAGDASRPKQLLVAVESQALHAWQSIAESELACERPVVSIASSELCTLSLCRTEEADKLWEVMDAQAVAGPSSAPYQGRRVVETTRTTTTTTVTEPVSTNGSHSTGTITQESSGSNGAMDEDEIYVSSSQVQAKKSAAVYQSSDPMIQKALSVRRTGYCYSSKMQMHAFVGEDDDEQHPEKPERIVYIFNKFQKSGVIDRMERIAVREAVKAEASLVHAGELWDKINSFAVQPPEFFLLNKVFFNRLSLYVNEHTAMCARMSLGGAIETCRAVADGRISNAFAIVRPPGHHAEPEQAMGFCFYNNVAVAAAYLKTVYKDINKVLILDWDVHHGNGTQKAFWTDPDVLYVSIHRHDNGGFYPGGPYGGVDQVGASPGRGKCVNIPWAGPGATDADYIYAFQKVVMPIAYEFAPDFVLVSAGFDAAEGDQLGGCHVSPAGYAHMTHMLSSLAGGKMVVALEGGYNVESIASSALECVKVLLGEIPPQMAPMSATPEATKAIHLVTTEQSRYWSSIRPTFVTKEESAESADIVPITEILKAHRTSHLWNKYKMYNVPLSDPILEETFKDQLLLTGNVFDAKTLVLYVHDMGNIRAELNALTADVDAENSFFLDTSSQVLEWVLGRNWSLVDVNILAHSGTSGFLDKAAAVQHERNMVLHVWDQVVQLATNIENVVLIGQSMGCHAIVNLLNQRSAQCTKRVKAAVQLFDLQKPPVLASDRTVQGLRTWFQTVSMAVFPAQHLVQRDYESTGERYGKVMIGNDPRPSYVLRKMWQDQRIQRFIVDKLGEPLVVQAMAKSGDTDMS